MAIVKDFLVVLVSFISHETHPMYPSHLASRYSLYMMICRLDASGEKDIEKKNIKKPGKSPGRLINLYMFWGNEQVTL